MGSKTRVTTFLSLPISEETKSGLAEAGYKHPTEIQKETLEPALGGEDILAAAKTGGGKTLAFVIPLLELLAKEKWSKIDGLGALIITPTRELAYQIYEVIRKVGKNHDFSLALVVGGKDLKFEWNRLHAVNIMVGTPGRLLHHMDNNANLSTDNLKLLILDEADRILDMGFQRDLTSIMEHLPKERQTLLFSATQTKSVQQLARLNLKDPVYISVDENAKHKTPDSLVQSYLVCELHEKLNVLWSFLKSHLHYKIIVFFSTCKQTSYIYKLFDQMRINTAFFALYGGLNQMRRMDIYDQFVQKKNAILFCTDIGARGLDFPDINWVIQFDCPEDTNTYIHRVGRTARHQKGGEAVLFLMPSEEEAMLDELRERNIPIEEIKYKPEKLRNIQERAAALCARELDLKQRAQRCFKTYLKSVYLMKNKLIFNIKLLDFNLYASSLGLEVSPRIRFLEKDKDIREKLKKERLKVDNSKNNTEENDKVDSNKVDSDKEDSDKANSDKADSDMESNEDQSAEDKTMANEDSDDDFMTLKRKIPIDDDIDKESKKEFNFVPKKKMKPVTKQSLAKKLIKRNLVVNKVKKFTEDDESEEEELGNELAEFSIEGAKKKLEKQDEKDKKKYREMKRKKLLAAKHKLKKQDDNKDDEEMKQTQNLIDELPDPGEVY